MSKVIKQLGRLLRRYADGDLKLEGPYHNDVHPGYGFYEGFFKEWIYLKAKFDGDEIFLSPNQIRSLLSKRPLFEVLEVYLHYPQVVEGIIDEASFEKIPIDCEYVRNMPHAYKIRRHSNGKTELIPKNRIN